MTMGGMGGMQMHIVGKPHLVIDADNGMTRSMNMQMSMTMQGTSSQISVTMDAK